MAHSVLVYSFLSNLLAGSISTGVFVGVVGVVVGLIAVILVLIVLLATVLLIKAHKMKQSEKKSAHYRLIVQRSSFWTLYSCIQY